MQWLVLGRQVSRAGWWVLASAIGWAAGWALGWVGGATAGGDMPEVASWIGTAVGVGIMQVKALPSAG
ncbi:MAG: hypothetical protein ACE5LU_22950 [Anaerolineae bacterium]